MKKNKALILSVSDRRHMSMSSIYEQYFNIHKIQYDIIRINRYEKSNKIIHYTNKHGDVYEYCINQSTDTYKINKIIPFLKFRFFALNIIKKNTYDFVVVWNENTAALFGSYLLRKYSKRYCVNVRDIFEISILKKYYAQVLKYSLFNTSPTPSAILNTAGHFITLYNHDFNVEKNVPKKDKLQSENEKIRITFMGLYGSVPKASKKLVDLFSNDDRYELYFYGDGFDTVLQDYINSKHAKNIITGGAFEYEKTYEYLKNTDIINSYYNNFDISPNLPYVAGVKQSYTPMLYLPSINDKNTAWGSICKKYNFSYLIDDFNVDTLPDDLYEWYHSIDFDSFRKSCDEFNLIVKNSQHEIYKLIHTCINNRK